MNSSYMIKKAKNYKYFDNYIAKFYTGKEIPDLDDKSCIEYIKSKFKRNLFDDNVLYIHIKKRIEIFKSLYKSEIKTDKFLDIGCGNTDFSFKFAENLGFNKKNVYLTDIYPINQENFIITDGLTLDFPDNSFTMIMCLQSLHHMTHLNSMLMEINRISKKSCILYIREHDRFNEEQQLFIDIDHMMYETLYENKTYENFMDSYYINCKTKQEWIDILESFGFKYLNSTPSKGYTNIFSAVFIKN